MKRITATLLLAAAVTYAANAQITLPYTNGFDNATQNADWVQYRLGLTMVNGSPSHPWEPQPSPGAVTAPNYLFHEYPIGYAGTDLTNDWLVSKSIPLTNGAKLSFKTWVYAAGGLMPGDTVEVYLLKGSQNPNTATKTKLASLRHMATTQGSMNAPVWKDTANISIPPTTGLAYLAFRYTDINDWFTVAIDNLNIVANPTSVANVDADRTQFRLYPNPASSEVRWQISSGNVRELQKQEGVIVNAIGQEVKRFAVKSGTLNIDFLQPGLYYMKIGDAVVPFAKQ